MSLATQIKEIVSDDQKVFFTKYFDGNLYYKSESGFEFTVPIDDIGTATFLAEDRAALFIRYIRKQLQLLEQAKLGE